MYLVFFELRNSGRGLLAPAPPIQLRDDTKFGCETLRVSGSLSPGSIRAFQNMKNSFNKVKEDIAMTS